MFFSGRKFKGFLVGVILLLPLFAVVRSVWSATSSTDGSTTISANYPTPPPPAGGGGDTTPPAAITNLVATASTVSTVTLTWTSTGDDGVDGLSNLYAIRYSSSGPITAANWLSATVVSDPPVPQLSGAVQSKIIIGLSPDTTYYFAIKAADEVPSWSAISNSPSAKTLVGPDVTAPAIQNIITTIGQPDVWPSLRSVNIGWQVVEASGVVTGTIYLGKTTSYELEPKSNFYSSPGGSMFGFNFIFSGLDLNTTYYFKITAVDGSGNQSETTDQTFVINWDDAPPVISEINSQPSINYAVINWTTDELADSQVVYSTNLDLLSSLKASAILTVNHALTLDGLTPNTQYYYAVRSTDANGNQGATSVFFFNTLPDNNPPANVANFQAAAGDGKTQLSWDNPLESDFAGVVIRRSLSGFPQNQQEGTKIYQGSGTNFEDSGLTNGATYFYTAFAYDTSNNYSSGATASAKPEAGITPPPTPPPPPPPPPPPGGCVGEACEITITPTSTISGFSLSDVDFFTAQRSLKIMPQEGRVEVLAGRDLIVSINPQVFVKEFTNLNLRIGETNYLFSLDRFGNYAAGVTLFSWPGDYSATVSFDYKDNQNQKEQLNFVARVAPGGLVYTISAGERQVLSGAKVELFYLNANNVWELWNASGYHQLNPQSANTGGSFGFVVPPGSYYLRTGKTNFKTAETMRFAFDRPAIVNNLVELVAAPPSLKEVIKLEAAFTENALNVAKNLGQKTVYISKIAAQEARKIITNPEVQKATEQVAAPTVAAVAAVGTTAAVGLSQFLLYLRFLFTQPILVLFRRRRKGWGVVYNSLTKRPADLVIVRLVDAATGRVVQSRVTDKEGRYAFMAVPGTYKIEINQPQFVFPTKFLAEFKDDGVMVDVYHGENIEVKEKGALITANIPLDPVGAERPVGRIIRQLVLRRLQNSLSIISIVLSLVFLAITPGILTGVLLGVQVVFYALFRHLAVPSKPKSWGIVYDKNNRNPVGSAVARIFDKQYNKLLETQITDKRGRYSFLVGRNEYYITYEKNGYEKRQTEPIDLKGQPEASAVLAPDTELNPLNNPKF